MVEQGKATRHPQVRQTDGYSAAFQKETAKAGRRWRTAVGAMSRGAGRGSGMAVLASLQPLVLAACCGQGGDSSNEGGKWFRRKRWDGNTVTAKDAVAKLDSA